MIKYGIYYALRGGFAETVISPKEGCDSQEEAGKIISEKGLRGGKYFILPYVYTGSAEQPQWTEKDKEDMKQIGLKMEYDMWFGAKEQKKEARPEPVKQDSSHWVYKDNDHVKNALKALREANKLLGYSFTTIDKIIEFAWDNDVFRISLETGKVEEYYSDGKWIVSDIASDLAYELKNQRTDKPAKEDTATWRYKDHEEAQRAVVAALGPLGHEFAWGTMDPAYLVCVFRDGRLFRVKLEDGLIDRKMGTDGIWMAVGKLFTPTK